VPQTGKLKVGFSPCGVIEVSGGRPGIYPPHKIVVLFLEINQRDEVAIKPQRILSERSESKDLLLLLLLLLFLLLLFLALKGRGFNRATPPPPVFRNQSTRRSRAQFSLSS
jgi:hypothetical protein